MNQIEIKLFLRIFLLFFITLDILTAIIFYKEYQNEVKNLEQSISYNMDICNFNMDDNIYACSNYNIEFFNQEKEIYTTNFLREKDKKPNIIYKEKNLFYKYYAVPQSPLYLKISYDVPSYKKQIGEFKNSRIYEFQIATLGVLLLTLLFSLYSLAPLKEAFNLTQEFIKDILHDFNTPISSLILNIKTLPKTKATYEKIHRIEQSLDTILSLQDNLKNYLKEHPNQNEEIELLALIHERIEPLENLYPNLTFIVEGKTLWLYTHRASISRILDNLLVNASKYNRKDGEIKVMVGKSAILISDTGEGIKNAKQIFNRFYKEHERGLGIGLHIVKKLSNELGIKIEVQSSLNKGTTFLLTFSTSMIKAPH